MQMRNKIDLNHNTSDIPFDHYVNDNGAQQLFYILFENCELR